MKKRKMPFLGIGAASILLVLTIVCLSVFAVLTLTSANGDYTLSKKNLERTTNYYEAVNQADEKVSSIDRVLSKSYQTSKNKKDYMKKVEKKLSSMKGITYHKNRGVIQFQQQIIQKQQINICLKVCYPKKKGDTYYKVVQWKNEATGTWKKDDSLPVFQRK